MKTKTISLQITEIEYEFLKSRSQWLGKSVSQYLSSLVLHEIKELDKYLKEK